MSFPNENAFDSIISAASSNFGVPFGLIKGVIAQESNFVQRAYRAEPQINDASYGLMQVLLATARGIGYVGTGDGLFDPQTNITVGTSFLSQLLRTAADSGWGIDSAISAYNAGFSSDRPGDGKRSTNRVDGYDSSGSQLAPFINQAYVNAVLSYAQRYSAPGAQVLAPVNVSAVSGGGFSPLLFVAAAVALGLALAKRRG
jgi:soluble lytic murein transglycosylase-like protein